MQMQTMWHVCAHLLQLAYICSCPCTQAVFAHKPSVAVYAHKLPATCKVLHILNKLQLAMQLVQNTTELCLTATGTKVTQTQQHRLSNDPLRRHLMALMTLYLLSRDLATIYIQTLEII